MNLAVKNVFQNLPPVGHYLSYWSKLNVDSHESFFQRWLFAFCSVHTTWEGNVVGYSAIKDFHSWLGQEDVLRSRLVGARCGLHNNRAKWIRRFSEDFWANPTAYYRRTSTYTKGLRGSVSESWRDLRNRLQADIVGLGPAKTSFALELAFPLEARVTCLDVHMLRLYGVKEKDYAIAEADWLGRSHAIQVPPFIARQSYWDSLQGKPDSRYWSHVFEDKQNAAN